MPFRRKSVYIVGGLALAVVITLLVAAAVHSQLPPLLRYALDGAFFLSMATVTLSVGVLALMFFRWIGITNGARAMLCLSVLLLTITSGSLLGMVANRLIGLSPIDEGAALRYTFSLLIQLVQASQLVLSVGTGGIALALLVGTFPKPSVSMTSTT